MLSILAPQGWGEAHYEVGQLDYTNQARAQVVQVLPLIYKLLHVTLGQNKNGGGGRV